MQRLVDAEEINSESGKEEEAKVDGVCHEFGELPFGGQLDIEASL